MTDVLNKEQRSYNMSRIRGKDTRPELLLRRYLFSKGLRGYRIGYNLLGKPDIVFPKYKTIIFVDGCFWHKCQKHFHAPSNNRAFWVTKIEGNVRRDKEVNEILKTKGWKVLRFWEHSVIQDTDQVYKIVLMELKRGGYRHDTNT